MEYLMLKTMMELQELAMGIPLRHLLLYIEDGRFVATQGIVMGEVIKQPVDDDVIVILPQQFCTTVDMVGVSAAKPRTDKHEET